MGVVGLGVDGADVADLVGVLDGPPIFVKEFVVAAVIRVVSLLLERAEQRLGAVQGGLVFRRLVVGHEAVKREGVQVDMLAGIDRFAVITDFGEIAAVFGIAKMVFQK